MLCWPTRDTPGQRVTGTAVILTLVSDQLDHVSCLIKFGLYKYYYLNDQKLDNLALKLALYDGLLNSVPLEHNYSVSLKLTLAYQKNMMAHIGH